MMFQSNLRRISSRPVYQQLRSITQGRRKQLPSNTVINFVPQQEAWIIERFGKFSKVLDPGLAILIPLIEQIRYVQSLKEVAVEVPSQSAITLDNVTLQLDGVLYYRVEDPYQASYGVEDCEYAVTQMAQTTMRSELGKITLDKIFQERTSLNSNIVSKYTMRSAKQLLPGELNVCVMKYVISSYQVKSKKLCRCRLKLSGKNEPQFSSQKVQGYPQSMWLKDKSKVRFLLLKVEKWNRLTQQPSGNNAASLTVAEQYVQAFGNLAKTSNTVILPANTGDAASMVAQAMAVYSQVSKPTTPEDPPPDDPKDRKITPPSNEALESHDNERPNVTHTENAGTKMDHDVLNSQWQLMSEPTHFTAASSPTRKRDFS